MTQILKEKKKVGGNPSYLHTWLDHVSGAAGVAASPGSLTGRPVFIQRPPSDPRSPDSGLAASNYRALSMIVSYGSQKQPFCK